MRIYNGSTFGGYTDDLGICAEDHETLQTNFEQWQHSFEQAGLTVNICKIEALITERSTNHK